MKLKDKVAIVTGGGTGIGRGIAIEFAKAGADVAVSGRRAAPLDEVVKEIAKLGRRGLAVPADVRDKEAITNLAERTTNELGDIDILVNNAANGGSGPSLLDSDEDRWDEIIDTNLKSIYFCCRAIAPGMIERKRGNIINISSISGMVLVPAGCRIYGIAKSAVNFLTRGLAQDLAPHGVRVNCIAPGPVRTEMLEVDIGTDEENWKKVDPIPLRRVGQPVDIATAALFLASDASNFVTAQTIAVDGGFAA